jgi:hypothetical protein
LLDHAKKAPIAVVFFSTQVEYSPELGSFSQWSSGCLLNEHSMFRAPTFPRMSTTIGCVGRNMTGWRHLTPKQIGLRKRAGCKCRDGW